EDNSENDLEFVEEPIWTRIAMTEEEYSNYVEVDENLATYHEDETDGSNNSNTAEDEDDGEDDPEIIRNIVTAATAHSHLQDLTTYWLSQDHEDENSEFFSSVAKIENLVISLVNIGVATYYYLTLTTAEKLTQYNCTTMNGTNLNMNAENFCQHVDTWKTCAICMIVIPGCLHFILTLLTKGANKVSEVSENLDNDQEATNEDTCSCLWTFISRAVTLAIVCVLWSSKALEIRSTDSSGLYTAAVTCFFVVIAQAAWLKIRIHIFSIPMCPQNMFPSSCYVLFLPNAREVNIKQLI
ncbi:unnamed protein product, partial [Allacma fusca]